MYVDQGCVTSCPHLCCWPPLGPLLGQLITAGSLYPGLSVLWRFGSSWAWLILCFTGITKVPMCPSVWQCGVGDPAVSSHRQGRQARHHVCLDQFSSVARLCPTICHPQTLNSSHKFPQVWLPLLCPVLPRPILALILTYLLLHLLLFHLPRTLSPPSAQGL